MLEHVPHWLGSALSGVRAGADRLAISDCDLSAVVPLRLSSPAFADGARLPVRFTADGTGVSPPLAWADVPDGTAELVLMVEDADAPTPRPIVHALMVGIDPASSNLPEGAIIADGDGSTHGDSGRNSYLREGWLPPDPPTGHGEHRYVFQLFALRGGDPIDGTPGRSELLSAIRARAIGAAVLTGTYSRGDEAEIGPIAAAPA